MNLGLPDFTEASVLVLGDIMLDRYIWGEVDRISPEAPIPVVHVIKRTGCLGGAGNVACNLARLGCKTKVLAPIGKDHFGSQVIDLMVDEGISNLCIFVDNFPTVTKTRVMGGSQQIVRIDDELPDRMDCSIRNRIYDVFCREIADTQAVIISDYGKGLFDDDLLQRCISLCLKKSVPVLIDPKRNDWTAYSGATCITPNMLEFSSACAHAHINFNDLELAGKTLLDMYDFSHLLVTRGSEGMFLVSRDGNQCSIPAQAIEVFDVSGAGDTVIAIIASGLATGIMMEESIALANIAAGEVVAHVGTYAISKTDLARSILKVQEKSKSIGKCSLDEALRIVNLWKMLGKRVVLSVGCFDLLHPGHISFLEKARKFGDKLIVGLNTDTFIRRIKGSSRPVLNQEDRAAILSALDCVDVVVTCFGEETSIDLIRVLQPDVLVKGRNYTIDQVVGAELLAEWGGKVELVEPSNGRRTSAILQKFLS